MARVVTKLGKSGSFRASFEKSTTSSFWLIYAVFKT